MNKVQCPTCNKEVLWIPENTFRPFCSERCRLIDLGAWADESYSIPIKEDIPSENMQDSDQET